MLSKNHYKKIKIKRKNNVMWFERKKKKSEEKKAYIKIYQLLYRCSTGWQQIKFCDFRSSNASISALFSAYSVWKEQVPNQEKDTFYLNSKQRALLSHGSLGICPFSVFFSSGASFTITLTPVATHKSRYSKMGQVKFVEDSL